MTLLLVDGDQFVFKACAAVEEEVRWDEQNHVLYANELRAWETVQGMLRRLQDRFFPGQHGMGPMVLCFSGSQPYFREQVTPGYKAGRSRKPLCYGQLREWLEGVYDCYCRPGLEADDMMGIMGTAPNRLGKVVIVSQDKDMKTIPATIWNGEHLITYSETDADYWHLFQTLTGDPVDGFKGCPGVGAVKAEKLLKANPSWVTVKAAYEKAGLTEADALQQARLARILRWSDWDSKKKAPILWLPPS